MGVLEPSEGVTAHLRTLEGKEDEARLEKLGFLKEYRNELGKLMMFVFVQIGEVAAVHYAPFGRRLVCFLERGKWKEDCGLVHRLSDDAKEKETLVELQRNIENLTGASDMLG